MHPLPRRATLTVPHVAGSGFSRRPKYRREGLELKRPLRLVLRLAGGVPRAEGVPRFDELIERHREREAKSARAVAAINRDDAPRELVNGDVQRRSSHRRRRSHQGSATTGSG